MQRSFRIFAAKEDLENIFTMLQQEDHIYYVPTYSDHQNGRINDILSVPGFGINTTGRKIGNHQFLIFYQESKCHWREIGGADAAIVRYSALTNENVENIFIDLGGVYCHSCLFPTEISTLHYENDLSNKLFREIKRIIRKNTSITKQGYAICENAYKQREKYRFCTINADSPEEYDLIVE